MGESKPAICHFGKHKDTAITEIPSGYLKWCVEKIDPVPLSQYRKHDDGTPMTVEEVNKMEEQMRDFLSAAEDELLNREQT